MTTRKPKSYDRQSRDTDKSWAAFCHYRDMGIERSLDRMIQDKSKTGTKISRSTLQSWSAKCDWVARCREFDNYELERQSIALQRERTNRKIARERAAENYRIALSNRARQMIDQPLRDTWTEKDIIAMLEASDRFAVISYGGDVPQIPLINAIEVLVKEGIIPDSFLEVALGGIDNFVGMMRSHFEKN